MELIPNREVVLTGQSCVLKENLPPSSPLNRHKSWITENLKFKNQNHDFCLALTNNNNKKKKKSCPNPSGGVT